MLSFNTTFSTKFEVQQKINMPDRSNGIAADIEANGAFPDRKTNPADLTKIAENMLAEVAGPDQRAAKKMGPGHFTK